MNNAEVAFTPGTLPPNYCFTTWQQLYDDMIAQLTGFLPGNFSTFNYGDSTPSPDNRDKPWFRTIGGQPDRWYVYFSGGWFAPYRSPAGITGERMLWAGSLNDLYAFDGGDGTPVFDNALTGSFWQEDTAFAARFPIGPGTLPSTTVINQGDTGGEEKHVLTLPELPSTNNFPQKDWKVEGSGTGGISGPDVIAGDIGTGPLQATLTTGGPLGSDTGHNNMPPYLGVYFAKRTTRAFYMV